MKRIFLNKSLGTDSSFGALDAGGLPEQVLLGPDGVERARPPDIQPVPKGLIGSLLPAAWLALAIQTHAGQARDVQRQIVWFTFSQS